MKKALFVTTDKYPDGDAGAVRTHTFAKMLQMLGYQPTVVGMGKAINFKFQNEDGIIYTSFRLSSSSIFSRIKGRLGFSKRLKATLLKKDSFWDVIFVGLVSRRTMNILKRYAKNKGTVLVHDSVEWYSPEQFVLGKFHPEYISMDLRNRRYVDQPMRVVAISSFLEKHFQNRDILTTRIPAILDVQKMPFEKKIDEKKVVFSYVGSPGKKDYLHVIVKGFALALGDMQSFPYELRIIGVTQEQLLSTCDKDDIEKLKERVRCYGRIPRQMALEHLKQTDFTVLMRSEEQRYAKAGFPTKFAESLATATPIICNATSDIADYLKDGQNGFLVADGSSTAFATVLRKAIKLSYEQRCWMQLKARETAEEYFDYRVYVDDLAQFMNHA